MYSIFQNFLWVMLVSCSAAANSSRVTAFADPPITNNAVSTLLGCECKSACDTSILFGCYSQPFCEVKSKHCAKGTAKYSYSHREYYDYCVVPEYKP